MVVVHTNSIRARRDRTSAELKQGDNVDSTDHSLQVKIKIEPNKMEPDVVKVDPIEKIEQPDPSGKVKKIKQPDPSAIKPNNKIELKRFIIYDRSPAVIINPAFMMDWIPYNPCVLLLPANVWARHCQNFNTCHVQGDVVVVTLFTKRPGEKYGSTVWIGITSFSHLESAWNNTDPYRYQQAVGWIVPPTFVQSVPGPTRPADPRLFLLGDDQDLAFIAYPSLAETSSIKGMRDYHVRLGVVASRAQRTECNNTATCPPFANSSGSNGSGEFFMNCSYSPAHCQDGTNLLGVEVQRHASEHVPQKNLQPLPSLLSTSTKNHAAHFLDFSPPDSNDARPVVYTVDQWTGTLVKERTRMAYAHDSCHELSDPEWRGSTPVVAYKGLFITIVHKNQPSTPSRPGRNYRHQLLVLSMDDEDESLQCHYFSSQEVFEPLKQGFYFAVGLAHIKDDQFMVSFGRNNNVALVQRLRISLVKKADPSALMQFVAFFVAPKGKPVTNARIQQFVKCFSSVRYHHPDATIRFYSTEPQSFHQQLKELVPFVEIVILDLKNLFRDTPAEPYSAKTVRCDWKELSDLVRLAILWKWGGTWVDTDDILIRPIPWIRNVVPYLEWPGVKSKLYWGSNFTLIDGKWKGDLGRDLQSGFHIQNDPLLNFEPGNEFLAQWMKELVSNDHPCRDWGQRVPTDIFRENPVWARRHVTLLPQHSLLLHPVFGDHAKKGPMFPLYDYRLRDNFPHYDTPVTESEFESDFQHMVTVQSFVAVKAKDNHHTGKGADKRWIPGWIASLDVDRLGGLVASASFVNESKPLYAFNQIGNVEGSRIQSKALKDYHVECPVGIRFKDENMRVCHLSVQDTGGDFGDELGPPVIDALLQTYFGSSNTTCVRRLSVSRRSKEGLNATCLMTLGSVTDFLKDGDHVWGAGINAHYQNRTGAEIPKYATYYSLAGPQSIRFLRDKGLNLAGPHGQDEFPYVDPGFLVPFVFPEYQHGNRSQSANIICFVPHYHDKDRLVAGAKTIQASQPWRQVFEQLSSDCDYVVSSSLPGLISADALGLPTMWFQWKDSVMIGTTEGSFAYMDYLESIGSPVKAPEQDLGSTEDVQNYGKPLSSKQRQEMAYRAQVSFPYELFELV